MCNLEEFKAWLEEKPERKENLPNWSFYFIEKPWKTITADDFEAACQKNSYEPRAFQPYRKVALKWVAERERERGK